METREFAKYIVLGLALILIGGAGIVSGYVREENLLLGLGILAEIIGWLSFFAGLLELLKALEEHFVYTGKSQILLASLNNKLPERESLLESKAVALRAPLLNLAQQ